MTLQPTTLYRFFGADGTLLYVGISHRLNERLSTHKRQKPWREVARITLEHFDTRIQALAAEATAIQAEGPEWNVVGVGSTYHRRDPIVGQYFHVVSDRGDGCLLPDRQGHIVAALGDGLYVAEFFSWEHGRPIDEHAITIGPDWRFFPDGETMREHFDNHVLPAMESHYEYHV